MKIAAIGAWQVDLLLKEGRYSWSNGNFVEMFDATVVAVATDAGITGYAECCSLGPAYLLDPPTHGREATACPTLGRCQDIETPGFCDAKLRMNP